MDWSGFTDRVISRPWLVGFALVVSWLVPLYLLVTVGLVHFDLLGFRAGFHYLRIGVYGGAVVFLVDLVLGIRMYFKRSLKAGYALLGTLLILLIMLYFPVHTWNRLVTSPPINDVTTDVEDPPNFLSLLARRAQTSDVPSYYPGGVTARLQQKFYPAIMPLRTDRSPSVVYGHALDVAQSLGWTIVARRKWMYEFEATATTFWFRFTDDIVVRVTERPGGSRVDVRSVSRVGQSDAGTNARRIKTFMSRLRSRLKTAGGSQ